MDLELVQVAGGPSLIDAELFGSARNCPNPGSPEREGLIGPADGGTLLLDEIGELPESLHARLLRVLDSHGEYYRLGESLPRRRHLVRRRDEPRSRVAQGRSARLLRRPGFTFPGSTRAGATFHCSSRSCSSAWRRTARI